MTTPRYTELQVTSHFSFLRGASSCEELFAQAADLGIEALAIVDRNSLAGIVRAHQVPAGVCRKDLQAARRVWQLRFSGKPCRLLRPDRLCLLLAEMLASRRLLRSPPQCPADGLLRAGADRSRCA